MNYTSILYGLYLDAVLHSPARWQKLADLKMLIIWLIDGTPLRNTRVWSPGREIEYCYQENNTDDIVLSPREKVILK